MTVHIKTTVLSLRQKAIRDDRMGLVKTRRVAAMHPPSRCALRRTGKQQRAKAGMGFARGKRIGFGGDCSGKSGKRGSRVKGLPLGGVATERRQ